MNQKAYIPRIISAIIVVIIISLIASFDVLAKDEISSDISLGIEQEGDFDIFRGWDDEDKSWFAASEVLLIADWGQSLDINRKGISDLNPILNYAPVSTVNTYFISWLIVNYFITDNLSGDYRKLWLKGLVLGEIAFVTINYGAGINIVF